MLSVLIPTYNTDCTRLVRQVHAQLMFESIEFEILIADDASTRPEIVEANRKLTFWRGTRYLSLQENIGPARIRNYLADQAKYKYLLFLDADTYPESPFFIPNYMDTLRPNIVICGGFEYQRKTPHPDYALRYYYGIKVEEKNAKQRQKHPYERFIGMNFLIDHRQFKHVRFDETMGFGYEDAYFGIQLKKAGVPIVHIDNPVYHLSEDTSEAYLAKTRRSIENLLNHIDKQQNHIRLLRWYAMVDKLHIVDIITNVFSKKRIALEKNLTSATPSLLLFAFYKLGYLCLLLKRKK